MRDTRPMAVLFTAFEPSGDDHASAVIAWLRRLRPDVKVYAWGGRKMAAAGAEVVEFTGKDAVMGMPGLAKIREHQQINERIGGWLQRNPVRVHVPVDSPAANFPICALSKRRGIRVVHLVAPQIWAWGSWRIRKLRRLTDLVLCLLPFEEGWFTTRGVPARFVGHVLFDEPLDLERLRREAGVLPQGSPRVALMPGSRPSEMTKNFPMMLDAFEALRESHAGLCGVVAAVDEAAETLLRRLALERGGWPAQLMMVSGQADVVIHWCQMALVVSGTVTLQIAKQGRPMVVFYKTNPVLYHAIARWLVRTRHFALPNLIAGSEIVPEFVPHFGGAEPIVREAVRLMDDPDEHERQRRDLAGVVARFVGLHAAEGAARAIAEMVGREEGESSSTTVAPGTR